MRFNHLSKLGCDWMLILLTLKILCQFFLKQFSADKWRIWTYINRQPIIGNETTNQVSLPIPRYPHLRLKMELNSHTLNAMYFGWLEQILLLISNPYFWLCKIPSNYLNSNCSSILTIQLNSCFSKLYFSLLIRTQIDCTNKHILADDKWINKAIWKLVLN